MSRFGNKCNVTACKELHDGIPHYYSKEKYCLFCARKINEANAPYGEEIFKLKDIETGLKVRKERDNQ